MSKTNHHRSDSLSTLFQSSIIVPLIALQLTVVPFLLAILLLLLLLFLVAATIRIGSHEVLELRPERLDGAEFVSDLTTIIS